MSEEIITAKDITKVYVHQSQTRVALRNVTFSLYEKEFLAILGPSGCGKTTLLRLISGLELPDEGEVLYRGVSHTEPTTAITMVFQNFALLPWKTAAQNITLALETLNLTKEQKNKVATDLLEKVGLARYANAYPAELSGGMKQRVGIARALAVHPEVVLLDEAFSSLDEITAEDLQKLIYSIWQDAHGPKGIILITHLIEEAVLLADRILIMSPGPQGTIIGEVKNTLPKPRFETARSPQFFAMCDAVREIVRKHEPEEKSQNGNTERKQ